MTTLNKETIREQVWLEAYLAILNSENILERSDAKSRADDCLRAFDERFPRN